MSLRLHSSSGTMKPEQLDEVRKQINVLTVDISTVLRELEKLDDFITRSVGAEQKVLDILEQACKHLRVGYKTTWIVRDRRTKYVSARRVGYYALRKATGMTIREMAHSLGVDYSTISKGLKEITVEEIASATYITR